MRKKVRKKVKQVLRGKNPGALPDEVDRKTDKVMKYGRIYEEAQQRVVDEEMEQ